MENLPAYISIAMILATIAAIIIFYKAAHKSFTVVIVLLGWLLIQSVIGLTGFFTVTDTIPPRILFIVFPPLLFTIVAFTTTKGRRFIDSISAKYLTLLHAVRIPVEIMIFWLFINKTMPQLMTIEGQNFDIISGLTAPVIFFFGYIKNKLGNKTILFWNVACLSILLVTVTTGVLSAPSVFQKLAFDQPNIAVLYFPFVWLPGIVVPLVYFSHLVVIRQTIKSMASERKNNLVLIN